jgi:hypothetical protein
MTERSKFVDRLRLLLKPFARLCIRHGFRLQDITESLKGAFVDVAVEELQKNSAGESVSKISVMSGVHRRDVGMFIKGVQASESAPSLLGKIIGHWQESKSFTDKQGKPKALTVEGANSEFVSLVKAISSDLNAYTVLFELERVGAVKRVGDQVILLRDVLDFQGSLLAGIEILAHDTADIYQAVEENCSLQDPIPNLHIRTEYDSIPVEHARDIKLWILGEGAKFQEKIQKHLSKFDIDSANQQRKKDQELCRISVSSIGLVQNRNSDKQ